jgi:hypothetical protein
MVVNIRSSLRLWNVVAVSVSSISSRVLDNHCAGTIVLGFDLPEKLDLIHDSVL